MAGTRNKRGISSELWCISCGKRGIPIIREKGKQREAGHRKAMYCIYCKSTVNHIETRNEEEARKFREDFAAGMYREEAEKSILFAKEHNI
jgi:hypothetical protein